MILMGLLLNLVPTCFSFLGNTYVPRGRTPSALSPGTPELCAINPKPLWEPLREELSP